ncbi:MAG: hypothetical protein JNM13_17345 [Hyphomicrobiaceae bacterium]|nr:hypothetical protein [Hyphomicrobiaceae bacterium]
MTALIDFAAETASLTSGVEPERVFDRLERILRKCGASSILMTGLSLPGRPAAPLVLRRDWSVPRVDEQVDVVADDAALVRLRTLAAPDVLNLAAAENRALIDKSLLLNSIARGVDGLVSVPVLLPPYQGGILAAGRVLDIGAADLGLIGILAEVAFRRLIELGRINPERPGGLSARERHVVTLTAAGKTAAEIAGMLDISQRTVHAHLQNASDKLQASNKTQTVVKALVYGQIEIAGLDPEGLGAKLS